MTIKQEMKRKAAEKLLVKYLRRYRDDPAWAWQQLRDAAQSADADGKEAITKETINTWVVKEHLRDLAEEEADALLADDTLNLNELNRIFG